MGELYRKFLNEPELAIDAYEAAQAFDPDGRERAETLAELYASDVTQYLEKAVKAANGRSYGGRPERTSSWSRLPRMVKLRSRTRLPRIIIAALPVKRVNISVSTGPGATALTRTPKAAPSSAADLVSPSTACLLAE